MIKIKLKWLKDDKAEINKWISWNKLTKPSSQKFGVYN